MKTFPRIVGAILLSCSIGQAAEPKCIVHEWGTFTSLQNEAGEAIGGINTDDEPLPHFVHRLAHYLHLLPTEIPTIFFQGAPSCHPDVTMRLETPVIYFHPPPEIKIQTADVRVKFRGGWMTEFYPHANPEAQGFREHDYSKFGVGSLFQFGPLHSDTEGKLTWNDIKIGGNWPLTNATEHVWTSPRNVKAASVQTTNGESEKFLFYRGVGHVNAPLKISRDVNSGELLFRSQWPEMPTNKPLTIRSFWLVDIQPGGKIAYRSLPPLVLDHNPKKILAHTPASFESSDFSSGNLTKLKTALHQALVTDGLFADEAHALLNTWELSYFKSAGLRVFFLLPRAWTDFYLPLETSLPADINRVMVGRIELITPEQRNGLLELSRFTTETIEAHRGLMGTNFYEGLTRSGRFNQEWEKLLSGKPLSQVISVPKSYQTYLGLGRFRNALVLDAAQRQTSLTNFIAAYRLQAYNTGEPPPTPGKAN